MQPLLHLCHLPSYAAHNYCSYSTLHIGRWSSNDKCIVLFKLVVQVSRVKGKWVVGQGTYICVNFNHKNNGA